MEQAIVFLNSILFDPNCILFTSAFILLMIALVAEVIGFVLVGTGIITFLDHFIPHATPNHHIGDGFNILHWAKHKNVPISIWIAIILSIFTSIGLIIQIISQTNLGYTQNMFIVSLIAIIPAIFVAKWTSNVFGSIIFVDTTLAVDVEDLVGCSATIIIGKCAKDTPAECKIIDRHDKAHYMRAIPMDDAKEFTKSDSLIVSEVRGNIIVVREKVKFNFI
jgi:hypothetical protein